MNCPECKALNPHNAIYCGSCGHRFSPNVPTEFETTVSTVPKPPSNGVRRSRKRSILLLAVLLVVLLTAGGTFAVTQLLNTLNPPHSTGISPCQYKYWQTGVTTDVTLSNFEVPQGCILVLDSAGGRLNDVSWTNGGVFAFSPGTYNGHILNGEYETVSIGEAKQTFCKRVQQIVSHGFAFSYTQPLPEWSLSPKQILNDGHC